MAKFAYLTQRVFLYLIYQGFCGVEEEDDPDVEPPSDLEKDGMGMGDGKGGDDNVADQIEHEEQLEGLKDYNSDEEKKEEK
jgi:midasin (ATPase involved in ribosome maturation)